jgi:hypothetical protein
MFRTHTGVVVPLGREPQKFIWRRLRDLRGAPLADERTQSFGEVQDFGRFSHYPASQLRVAKKSGPDLSMICPGEVHRNAEGNIDRRGTRVASVVQSFAWR